MKNKNPNRKKYLNYSDHLVKWVEGLGIHQTGFGRLINFMESRLGVKRLLAVFIFSIFVSILVNVNISLSHSFRLGQIATSDIKAPESFNIIDEKNTFLARQEAVNGVPPVFDFYPQAYDKLIKNTKAAFSQMRSNDFDVAGDGLVEKENRFELTMGVEFQEGLFEWLNENNFNADIENVLLSSFSSWSEKMIYDGAVSLPSESINTVSVKGKGDSRESLYNTEHLLDTRKKKLFKISVEPGEGFDEISYNNIKKITHTLLVPNLIFNLSETEARRQKASEHIQPTSIKINRNHLIVAKGELIQSSHLKILNEIQKLKSFKTVLYKILLTTVLFFILMVIFLSFVKRFTANKVNILKKDLAILSTITLVSLLTVKLFIFISETSLYMSLSDYMSHEAFLYLAPLAMAPMLAGLLVSSGEMVWLFTLFFAVVLSSMIDFNFNLFIVSLGTGVAAARGVYSCEKRNDIYFAGFRAGLVAALLVFLLGLLSQGQSNLSFLNIASISVTAFLGGVISALFALMIIPALESLFNCTTDVKLLELSNLSHPLMKEMIMKSPGTYHHALAVGNMVEEAANKIEANALLAKVMAYYHDIGKIEHAQYFIENQRPGLNPHDDISPFMSKTVIIAHVKDGAELAIKHKLGRAIVDGILQHHGTTLIRYFYNKALELKGNSEVKETEFRYPGPKPQFKEAALVMLADSIEAAARSIAEPTPAKLTSLVQNIIQSKFIDGQLNECNLTFKELSMIEEAFKKTILNIYHHRIDYPQIEKSKQKSNDLLKFKKKKK